jgi:flagellar biosynthetic protein FlhB
MQSVVMMSKVKNSDVIIVDANRYAVAIKFDENTDEAPMIVVRGNNSDATLIQQIARQHGVHSIHNPPLAQALCGTCLPLLLLPLTPKQIPEEHYLAVAEILAYVYQLAKEKTQ